MLTLVRYFFFSVCFCLLSTLYAQPTSDQAMPISFNKLRADIFTAYADPDGILKNKQVQRTLHYLRDRTDVNGYVINTIAANMQALQQLYVDTTSNNITGNWQFLGPNYINSSFTATGDGAGRVNCIAFASAATWYVGTAGGGLWKTNTAGIYVPGLPYSWTPMTDSLPINCVSGVVVNPLDTSIVYILTGDGDGSGPTPWGGAGIGILKSSNGGLTWDTTSLTFSINDIKQGYKLLMHPDDPDIMFAATNDGLYMTTDGWTSPPTQVLDETCFDIEFHPTNPDIMYAVGNNWLRRSEDGGNFFSNVGVGAFNISNPAPSSRIAIAVTPDLPDALYAILVNRNTQGLLSLQFSNDTCNTFAEMLDGSFNILTNDNPETDSTGQGNYDLTLWANPDVYTQVFVGGVDLWKTNDLIVWTKLTDWDGSGDHYIHADVHMFERNPFTGDLLVGTDGGLSLSDDNGSTWNTRSVGLGITQLYHFDVRVSSIGLPTVGCGTQDNGSSYWYSGTDGQFLKYTGGDGFRIYSGDNGENLVRYTSIQNGRIMRYDIEYDGGIPGATEITPQQVIGDDGDPTGAWDTPYAPSAHNFEEMMAGYRHLYYNLNGDDTWQELQVDGYNSDDRIMEIEWGNSNPNVFYFLMMDGDEVGDSIALFSHLYRVGNLYNAIVNNNLSSGNLSLMVLDTLLQNMLVTDLEENPNDPNELWFTVGGYADSVKVFYNPNTTNSAFQNISYNLPNAPVHCAEYDDDGIYVGTEIGVFFLHHGDTIWQYHSLGLATAPVTQLEVAFFPWGKYIWAGTYGRGIWFSDPPQPLRRTRWYVDDTAVGNNDGSNWTDAFPDLQTALDTVYPGDSIWVATGTYLPTSASGFSLFPHHVYIWGGFEGTEDSVSQRDFMAYPTILSGDIGIPNDSLDNAHHVISFTGSNEGVLLDGFHITHGYAHNAGSNSVGGGVYYSTGTLTGKPIIQNCRFYGNSSTGAGGALFVGDYAKGDPAFRLMDCTFENNSASIKGGSIYLDSSPGIDPDDAGNLAIIIDNCTITSSSANSGGAIQTEAAYTSTLDLTINDCYFAHNRALAGDGGSIYCSDQTNGNTFFTVNNTTFDDSRTMATNSGGGLYFYTRGDTLSARFSGCAFDSCYSYYGGSIEFDGLNQAYHTSFDSCLFTQSSGVWGGAIRYLSTIQKNAISEFTHCTFGNNTSTNRGGAIHYEADGSGWYEVTLDTCSFTNNAGGSGGGALSFFIDDNSNGNGASPGKLNLSATGSLFDNNSATHSGAVWIWLRNSIVDINLESTDFINNTATNVGGAIQIQNVPGNHTAENTNFSNCTFENNTGPVSGGALYLQRTNANFNNCMFTQNKSLNGYPVPTRGGGAVRIYGSNSTVDTVSHIFYQCVFDSNSAQLGGGALSLTPHLLSRMYVEIDSCTFQDNYTTYALYSYGGAIRSNDEGRMKCYIRDSEFIENHSAGVAGAIAFFSDGVDTTLLDVTDCVFTNNTAAEISSAIQIHKLNPGLTQSTWTNCTFHTEQTKYVFHNFAQSSGINLARFHNSYIYFNPP